jgi:hypothetical protein
MTKRCWNCLILGQRLTRMSGARSLFHFRAKRERNALYLPRVACF